MAISGLRFANFVSRNSCRAIERRFVRSYSSALFIPGSKASENFSFLTPYLDFDQRFADVDKLRKELSLRGTKIDADDLVKSWNFYKHINASKWAVEEKRNEIAQRMKQLKKKKNISPEDEKEQIRLTTQGKVLKQDIRIIKESLWEMEESIVVQALRLPNELHENTPTDSPIVLRSVGEIREPPADGRMSNEEIGKSQGLLDYKNPIHCYLCDEAALFELGAVNFLGEILADAEMTRIAGTDFSRSLVVEASGQDHQDPMETFVLRNNEGIDRETCNRLHLIGGASLVSFLSMHTKQLINPNYFPLRYFATGRKYVPFVEGAKPSGLFTVCQTSAAEVFVLTKDPESDEYKNQFDNLVETISKIYDDLDVHYRVVVRSARELRPWESLRISYEMWSAYSREYVEVGNISMCGRYFSKRLLIAYQTPTGRGFPAVITGTVLSISKLLGCLLEENPNKLRIPPKIARHMLGFDCSTTLPSIFSDSSR